MVLSGRLLAVALACLVPVALVPAASTVWWLSLIHI